MTEPWVLRPLSPHDIPLLPRHFAGTPWERSEPVFREMLEGRERGDRRVLVAQTGDRVVGHGTLLTQSQYPPFRRRGTHDLVVHPRWRGRGIGTALMGALEELAGAGSSVVGLGVGLHEGYGPAHRLYARLGYVPDGRGACYRGRPVAEGEVRAVDDHLLLWMVKELSTGRADPE